MRYVRLIGCFMRAAAQQEMIYHTNFFISLLHSLLNFGTGILSLVVLFGQVKNVHGWNFPATLALLGVYLTLSALRGLFIEPSLDALAGIGGELWTGKFDFTLLRPLNAQFLASFRYWRLFGLMDLVLGLIVLLVAITQLEHTLTLAEITGFLLTLSAAVSIIYAILLLFTGLLFWSPGFLFTWIFDGIFQMARYPVGLYPGWLQLLFTWIIPVGVMTTLPAQALIGALSPAMLLGAVTLAILLVTGASVLFQIGLRRYTSASS
jgi:ABC-2 type transport system permease protein